MARSRRRLKSGSESKETQRYTIKNHETKTDSMNRILNNKPIMSDGSPFKPSGCWPCKTSSIASRALVHKVGWEEQLSLMISKTLRKPISTTYITVNRNYYHFGHEKF